MKNNYEIKEYYGRFCLIKEGWNIKSFATKKRAETYLAELTQEKIKRQVPVNHYGKFEYNIEL